MSKLFVILAALGWAAMAGGAPVNLSVQAKQPVGHVDERIYSHFLEHIYHSVNGGLWGDLVWNRSFEDMDGAGLWSVEKGLLRQSEASPNVRLTFGDATWTNYEYSLELRRTGGSEGALVMFRVAGPDDFYWVNLGAVGNQFHWVERGWTGEGRWKVVHAGGNGSLENNRWYRVKVRCEGPHTEVRLDDKVILDYTDKDHPHLAGGVGVGSWATTNEFRNIRVSTLDGKPLFTGLPKPVLSAKLRSWLPYGPGTAQASAEKPLNSRYCARMIGADGETGLAQPGVAVHSGEVLTGSLFARGSAPDGLVVRLLDGAALLCEQALPSPGASWKELPIRLKPMAACRDATLQVGVRGKSDVSIDQVSLVPEAWKDEGGFRPDLLAAVKDLRAPVIRWPGGCYAEFYRWKDGIGPQARRGRFPINIWEDVDPNSLGTDEFIDLCRLVGSEPMLVVNSGRHDPNTPREAYIREACEWLEYCNGPATSKWGAERARNGHSQPYGVKYWEIDNEAWPLGPEEYSRVFNLFAAALRKVDPTIKLLACGSAGYGNEGIGQEWNRKVIAACAPGFDFLSIHHYEDPNRFAEGPLAYERFFQDLHKLLEGSANPAARVFVSEWNAQSTDWRTGLYAGGILNAFERQSNVIGIASPALFLRHTSATDWDNALVNFNQSGWFPAPNYVVMKLWRDHYQPNLLAVTGDTGKLSVVATGSADGKVVTLKVVNPTDAEQAVTVALPGAASAAVRMVAPGKPAARNTLAAPHAVDVVDGHARAGDGSVAFTAPPLSALVVVVTVR